MRLCGISTCFQVLSPGIRQVTHALLTRPPLGWYSLGFISSPFDLHVLSTPPAFILSQDQTLMLIVLFLSDSLSGFSESPFPVTVPLAGCLCIRFPSPVPAEEGFFVLWIISFLNGIFRVALLFICQGAFVLLSSATAYLEYHNSFAVSTTFFNFFHHFFLSQMVGFNTIIFPLLLSTTFSKKSEVLLALLISLFGSLSGERGIWTLAPVTRPTPLAGAPLRPLEYFSMPELRHCQYFVLRRRPTTQKLLYIRMKALSITFFIFLNLFLNCNLFKLPL